MSLYQNVTVSSGSRVIATGVIADVIDDAEQAQAWGGAWESEPTVGQDYLLAAGGLLDWTGTLTGGDGTESSPYGFTVTDSERERRAAKLSSAC